ncbi:MAG: hypothetical protein IM571_03010 [Chitinophagaceae bacterium]|jgi:hypothetical protein|nr:hypothetical protein [Chitinophagaceae bacterium]MCA6469277.1 hypothetical protein [Chitinophagaceae bacterium]MCA6476903.1 hypothetical protein [Chitinophagaceae bacterium]MCA6479828.1 hypothetical protein [Chitinophagaceae bacterium]MCA6485908.1 hypothetical protein [Chitinophagaceae bacterium]
MEVHHHTHHPKKWKEYFWEFFMLFLAVFCGFLAEYMLEHKIENDRAKELAKSFYEELVEDSVRLDKIMEMRYKKEQCTKYLIHYFTTADYSREADTAMRYMSFAYISLSSRVLFEPSEGIINQLQNSGSRRYFKNQQLQNTISHLSSSISFVKLRNEREMDYITHYLRPFCIEHLNYDWLNEFTLDGKLSVTDAFLTNQQVKTARPYLKNTTSINRDKAANIGGQLLLLLRGMRNATILDYRKAASNTMKLLREEFPELKK